MLNASSDVERFFACRAGSIVRLLQDDEDSENSVSIQLLQGMSLGASVLVMLLVLRTSQGSEYVPMVPLEFLSEQQPLEITMQAMA